jgi:hypothetical protein
MLRIIMKPWLALSIIRGHAIMASLLVVDHSHGTAETVKDWLAIAFSAMVDD